MSETKHIDHIGIAVKDLEASKKLYNSILGKTPDKEEIVASENVKVAFYTYGDTKLELLEGLSEESAIRKFVEKKGEGMHHIAFEVSDIEASMRKMQAEGYRLIKEKAGKGADNKLVNFLHPKETGGVLIELCQTIKN
jgi:methylmalonyl-CoA/ethylmalonyl-CoA epimerase